MEFEYWWLLVLPIFFGLGWVAARIDISQLLIETRKLPASYFRGLNFLISEQPDKAIEAFMEALKADGETLELHFALGSLFRRTGEMDRAIRLHQGLLDRSDLPEIQRLMALAELGQDYVKAGLFDRAEEIFSKLVDTRYAQSALRALLEIYEREKEWKQAIAVAQKLETLRGRPLSKEIAEFYCELALQQQLMNQNTAAKQNLEQAMSANRLCIRANIMLGDIEATEGNHEKALELWRSIELQSAQGLELVCERMMQSWTALNRANEGLAWLTGVVAKYHLEKSAQTLFLATLNIKGPEAAYRIAHDEAAQSPSLASLDRLLQAKVSGMPDGDLRLVMDALKSYIDKTAVYRCNTCGYSARQFHWHCPGCGEWESFPPSYTRNTTL